MATILTVTRVDNEVAAFLNGLVVYDKKTEGNPAFNDQIPLDPYLIAFVPIHRDPCIGFVVELSQHVASGRQG